MGFGGQLGEERVIEPPWSEDNRKWASDETWFWSWFSYFLVIWDKDARCCVSSSINKDDNGSYCTGLQ